MTKSDQPTQPSDPWQQRRAMVDRQLQRRGIKDARILEAMLRVPREKFVPVEQLEAAFDDRAIPIACGQTISQPYIVAYMTEQLSLTPDCRVLEVGTGSGYQAAILSLLCQHLYTVERVAELRDSATSRLTELGFSNVTYRCGDGSLGWPEHAPFDRIIVTAGAPDIPKPLLSQLTDGGIMVAPIGDKKGQTIIRAVRRGSKAIKHQLLACRFVKLVGEAGWTPSDEEA